IEKIMVETNEKKLDIYIDGDLLIADFHKDWGENEVKEYGKQMKALLDASDRMLYHLIIVRWVPADLIVLGMIWRYREDMKAVLFHEKMHREIFKISSKIIQIMGENSLKILGLDTKVFLISVDSIEEAKQKLAKKA